MKGKKTDLPTSKNANRESHEKNCSETTSMVETGKFYISLFMSICTRENSSYSAQVLFFLARTSLY